MGAVASAFMAMPRPVSLSKQAQGAAQVVSRVLMAALETAGRPERPTRPAEITFCKDELWSHAHAPTG